MLSSGGVGADMMSDAARDPAIKLFGRTIAVPESQSVDKAGALCDPSTVAEASEDEKDMCQELIGGDAEDSTAENPDEDHSAQDGSSCLNGANSAGQENGRLAEESKPENDQAEPEVSPQEKVLKKPDKILPCPRCNSLDTKFCYYNNYNVNQPRHFCKNCQRYWTAGGTMRNVPVGAGRRKNKHSASHYHQLVTSSESMSPPQLDVPDFPNGQSSRNFNGNRAVLKFGPEAPLCESMVSVLSLRNQKKQGHVSLPTCNEKEKEPSCASSVTAPNHLENEASENVAQVEENAMHSYCNGITPVHPLHCYPGPPWAFPWSPSWNDVSAMAASRCSDIAYGQENGNANPIPWTPTPMMAAAPAFVAPTVPFPFIPASFWGCMASWPDGAWKVPWVGAGGGLSPSSSASNSGCLGSHPPRLGKHSRDVTPHAEEKVEKSLWAPKTLRIDDPEEAAKSSIWATLGIKHDQNESMGKSGIFKSFQPRSEDKAHQSDATQVLYANPAALSRSQTFQESN